MSEAIEKKEKIYPKSVKGRFRTIRSALSCVLLGVYFILPWLKIDGRQALLFDIPERKFYIFNLVFWPQEVYYLALLMIFLVLALFFFTALAGRLWCGYACPQTVFTDIFIRIERLIEGDRRERMAMDKGQWTANKAVRKTLKHGVWLLFSFATAFAFVSYFVPPAFLIERIMTNTLTGANIFWLGFFTLATYGDCAFLRELMCMVPCPYGRFQSALFDSDSLIIGYDAKRGEPREALKKGGERTGGDCVDCRHCVHVCPTGIDIRNGLQYECIACAQCVDACNAVMRKTGRAEGLIRYCSQRSLVDGARARIFRPRIALYTAGLAIFFSILSFKIATRVPLDLEVLRDRASLYTEAGGGKVSNLYTIKAMNMDTRDHRYIIKTSGIEADIVIGNNPILVKSGEVYQAPLSLIVKKDSTDRKVNRFDFIIEDTENPQITAKRGSTFLLPEREKTAVRVSKNQTR